MVVAVLRELFSPGIADNHTVVVLCGIRALFTVLEPSDGKMF